MNTSLAPTMSLCIQFASVALMAQLFIILTSTDTGKLANVLQAFIELNLTQTGISVAVSNAPLVP